MHRGLRSGPRMGELFQGQDGSLWRSVGPLEVGAALAGRDEEVYRRSAVGLGFMGLGQTMAGQYRADHSPSIKQSGMVILAAISAQA